MLKKKKNQFTKLETRNRKKKKDKNFQLFKSIIYLFFSYCANNGTHLFILIITISVKRKPLIKVNHKTISKSFTPVLFSNNHFHKLLLICNLLSYHKSEQFSLISLKQWFYSFLPGFSISNKTDFICQNRLFRPLKTGIGNFIMPSDPRFVHKAQEALFLRKNVAETEVKLQIEYQVNS